MKLCSLVLVFLAAWTVAGQDDCFTSTEDILMAQVGGQKELVICPDTIIDIGVPTDNTFAQFTNGSIPLTVISDDTTIKCGQDGSSSNNCVLNGGFVQLATTPALAQVPGVDVTTNNLTIQGLTFQGEIIKFPELSKDSVLLAAPGMDMVFEDVVFADLTCDNAISLTSTILSPNFPPESASLTIRNSVFRDCTYSVVLLYNNEQELYVSNVTFENIKFEECDSCDGTAIASIIYGYGYTGMRNNVFQNVEFNTSVAFIREYWPDDSVEYSGNTGSWDIDEDRIGDPWYCPDGLIYARSEMGLDLSSEDDECLVLLEAEPAEPEPTTSSATRVARMAATIVSAMVLLLTMM